MLSHRCSDDEWYSYRFWTAILHVPPYTRFSALSSTPALDVSSAPTIGVPDMEPNAHGIPNAFGHDGNMNQFWDEMLLWDNYFPGLKGKC